MKRAIIVHCWSGTPSYCWYPQSKKELEGWGFHVQVPAMPDTDTPELSKWLAKLTEVVGTPDEDTYLIGHGLGCITILHYLESLKADQKIGGVILVSGFSGAVDASELDSFVRKPVDFESIKKRARGFVAIHSDNDSYVPISHGNIFRDKLGAELVIKHGAGHFSGSSDGEALCIELPEVIEAAIKLSEGK